MIPKQRKETENEHNLHSSRHHRRSLQLAASGKLDSNPGRSYWHHSRGLGEATGGTTVADDPGGTGIRNKKFANHGSSSIERTKLATLVQRDELLSLFFRPFELRGTNGIQSTGHERLFT